MRLHHLCPKAAPKRLLSHQQEVGSSRLPPSLPPPHPAPPMTGHRRGAPGIAQTVPVLESPCPPRCPASATHPGRAFEIPQTAPMGLRSPPCLPRCPGSWPTQSHRRARPRLPSPWPCPMTSRAPTSPRFLRNATCQGRDSSRDPGALSLPHHQPEAPVTTSLLPLCSQITPPKPQVQRP